ncbi:DUF5946 family protein [Herbidospora sp. RD11066]
MTCECGAAPGPLGGCADYYHAILSEEQRDPAMWPWHAPVVCAYLLQHPGDVHEKYLDVQFRWLQLLIDQGIDAVVRVAAYQRKRNRRQGYDLAPFEKYDPLPTNIPGRFRESFSGLPVIDGSFVSDGHEAYGRRVEMIAEATVDAWKSS